MVKNMDKSNCPQMNGENETFKLIRVESAMKDVKKDLEKSNFSKQFYHLYITRLNYFRPILEKNARKKWDEKILKLTELEENADNKCIIIGTLFKHQPNKPSILRQLCDDVEEEKEIPEVKTDYCSSKDQPWLEDDMLRIKLVGPKVDLKEIITGVICAILGKKLDDGTFKVEDWCFAGCPERLSDLGQPSKGKLLLVSGLNLCEHYDSINLNLMKDWVCGIAGSVAAQTEASSIVNLIIAGNSVKAFESDVHISKGLMEAKAQESVISKEISTGIKKLDQLLSDVLPYCSVTLMPGQFDPTNYMLPQQQMHRLLFKQSRKFTNLKGAPNPWVGNIGNRLIIGSSGQPIQDLLQVSGDTAGSLLEWLEKTLEWRHISPTAPDTVPTFPYQQSDPFIMENCPDIYFVSNSKKFETKLWTGSGRTVRLVSIPNFSTTNTAVLIDLQTLDTIPIHFGTS